MKSVTLLTTLMLGLCAGAHAGVYHFDGTPGTVNSGVIPDNTTLWSNTLTPGLGGLGAIDAFDVTIRSVKVNLTITGGWNGDLFGYLSHNGVLVPLLTRVGYGTGDETPPGGFGYGTSGMNVTLSDAGTFNIHDVISPTGGPYKPDGRTLGTGPGYLPGAPSTTPTFASYTGGDPTGGWTLFFSDMSPGGDIDGGDSTVVSWSLDITAVPEPINVALGVFGGLFLIVGVCRSERVKKLFGNRAPVAAIV